MKQNFLSAFFLLFLSLHSISAPAQICGNLFGSSRGFSPAQFFLKQRRAALLGARYGTGAAVRGGRGSGSAKGWSAPESQVNQALSRTHSRFDISKLLELLDPLPGQGTSIPSKRKIMIQSQSREGINYIYTNQEGSFIVPSEVFQTMAEVISLSRSQFHEGQIKFELTDEMILNWFAKSLSFVERDRGKTTLDSGKLELAYKIVIAEEVQRVYSGRLSVYAEESDAAYYRPLHLMEKAATQEEIQQVVTILELIVGRRKVETIYSNFVKSVVALLDNPDAKQITEVTEDRQTVVPIDIKQIKNSFQLIDARYRALSVREVLEKSVRIQWVSNLKSYVPNADLLLPELRAYSEAILHGQPARKNQAVLIPLLFLTLRDQMDQQDFRDLVNVGHTLARDSEKEMKRFNDMFPAIGSHFGLSGWEAFALIEKTMKNFPFGGWWWTKR